MLPTDDICVTKRIDGAIVCIYPTLPLWVGYETRTILKQSSAALNLEFSLSQSGFHTKAKEPNLLIAGERTDGFMPFPRALVLCETQMAL